jgi:hypothetical protein
MASEHRCPRGKESAQPGPGLTRGERVNPARVRAAGARVCVPEAVGRQQWGRNSVWWDRVPKKRMPAAETQQETADRKTGNSSRRGGG